MSNLYRTAAFLAGMATMGSAEAQADVNILTTDQIIQAEVQKRMITESSRVKRGVERRLTSKYEKIIDNYQDLDSISLQFYEELITQLDITNIAAEIKEDTTKLDSISTKLQLVLNALEKKEINHKESLRKAENFNRALMFLLALIVLICAFYKGLIEKGKDKINAGKISELLDKIEEQERLIKDYLGIINDVEKENKDLVRENTDLLKKIHYAGVDEINDIKRKNAKLLQQIKEVTTDLETLMSEKGLNDFKERLEQRYGFAKQSLQDSIPTITQTILDALGEVGELEQKLKKKMKKFQQTAGYRGLKENSLALFFDSSVIQRHDQYIQELIPQFSWNEDGTLLVENPAFYLAQEFYQKYEEEYAKNNLKRALELVHSAKIAFIAAKTVEEFVIGDNPIDNESELTPNQQSVINELIAQQKEDWIEGEKGREILINFYDVLGLTNLETEAKIIKKARRKKAIEFHPDKHPENQEWAKAMIQQVNLAYEVLEDTAKQTQYVRLFKKYYNL